jgi:hypothetical protein
MSANSVFLLYAYQMLAIFYLAMSLCFCIEKTISNVSIGLVRSVK